VLGNQQPEADHVVADLIGQTLPYTALDADRIAVHGPRNAMADLCHETIVVSARPIPVEFFLKPILGEHAFYAPDADLPAALHQFLGDHLRRGIRVEKTVPDHLPLEFRRAARTGLGPAFSAPQGLRALFDEGRAELEIALLAEANFSAALSGPGPSHSPS